MKDKVNAIISNEKVLFLFCSLIILIIRLINIDELYGPFVMNDEAGYWSHAANIAGMKWREVLDVWYSYGYSLLLAPLFLLTHNMTILYRIAIVENALMGIVSFWLTIKIIKEFNCEISSNAAIMYSFISSMYSAYVFQSQIGWSETCIYTCFLVVLYYCIKYLKQMRLKDGLLWSASVGVLYIVHNRTLAVVIAFMMMIGLLFIIKKIDLKNLFKMLVPLFILFVFNHFAKDILSEVMWGTIDGFHGNDTNTVLNNLDGLLSWDGLTKLIMSFIGKIWYLLVATLSLGFWGVIYLIWQVYKDYKSGKSTPNGFFSIYCLLCLCGTLCVAAMAMIHA